MRQIRVKENIDRRYLGAVCFVDNATLGMVRRPFTIDAEELDFIVNPSRLHVIDSADGLEGHTHSFASPPDQPPVESKIFNVIVSDPLQIYLPRIKRVELPRNPDPMSEDSLFDPIQIAMFSSSSRGLNPNWSVIRASVYRFGQDDPDDPLGGVLLRVVREEDSELIASGLTDHRGEALIIAAGIPFYNYVTDENRPDDDPDHDEWLASGDVVEKEISVKFEAVVDNTLPWPVDPEALEENRNAWLRKISANKNDGLTDSVALKLKPGQTQIIRLYVNVSDDT